MENCNMAKDIVQEAVEQAEAMKEAAYENAKSVLVRCNEYEPEGSRLRGYR